MKNINDLCIVISARMGSQRVPQKMLRPFSGTTLMDILLSKLLHLKNIPKENIYFSVYENELKQVVDKYKFNIFSRSKESAYGETDLQTIIEWHDKLPYKYAIEISACNPLLKVETIDNFIKQFIKSDQEGAFAVFEKRTYYWDKEGHSITDWKGLSSMNTKIVDPIYEAGHCLYATRMDIIKDNFYMDTKSPAEPELFIMPELEAFDIDYEWQFQLGEQLYKLEL